MKKFVSMLLAAALSVGCLAIGASCKPKKNIVKDPQTINVKLYKAGFGDEFLYEFADKFNAAFSKQGYKINIVSALYETAGEKVLQEMYQGYEENQIDLYITGALTPFQLGPNSEYGESATDLRELVFNQPVINYDGSYAEDTVGDRFHPDLVPFLCDENGKMYGVAWAQTSAGMVVNTQKLAKYGVTELPRTTNELFEIFDIIYNGNGTVAGSNTTKTYPLTYTLDKGVTYQNSAFLTWFAQYDVETYNEFLRMQTKTGSNTWTNMSNGYEVFDNSDLVDTFEAGFHLLDSKYAAAGSDQNKLDQAQALIMKAANGTNNAVFMLNGDWFLNEVKANYSENLNQIAFMNVPVISALGVKVFGVGTKYALSDEECDELLSYMVKLVDENKTIEEISTAVEEDFDIALDKEDVERIAQARGVCFARGIEHLAIIPKDSTKKNIAALALRMMASEDFARTFINLANATSPYAQNLNVTSRYSFVNQAQTLVTSRYFSPINSRVQGLRFKVLATDAILPHVTDTKLTFTLINRAANTSYRNAAISLVSEARKKAAEKWNAYF